MASAMTTVQKILPFPEVYNIVKRNDQSQYDLVYSTLLSKHEYLSQIPDSEDYSILHLIVQQGSYDFFNRVIAIPNIRFILLSKSASKPPKDVLQIATENKEKSPNHKRLYQTISNLIQMDKFVEYAKHNQISECRNMLHQDPDLANQKPPYRKYYLIHHLAFANNRNAFDQLRQICDVDLKLLTNDHKTAAEVALEQGHKGFAEYLESFAPGMQDIRKKREEEKEKRNQAQMKHDAEIEKQILSTAGNNMLECFTCPLTKELFHDPVVLCDGFTYERSAIQRWLDLGNRRSPMTNIELPNTTLE